MTGPMATRDGDVVIAHRNRTAFAVWAVTDDGQQEPRPDTHVSIALGRPGALQLGRMIARDSRGAVFVVEQDGVTWTKVYD